MRYGVDVLLASDSEEETDDHNLLDRKLSRHGYPYSADSNAEEYPNPVRGQSVERTPPPEEQQFKRFLDRSRRRLSGSPLSSRFSPSPEAKVTLSLVVLQSSPERESNNDFPKEFAKIRRVSQETIQQRLKQFSLEQEQEIDALLSQLRLNASQQEARAKAQQEQQTQELQKGIKDVVRQAEAEAEAAKRKSAKEHEERLRQTQLRKDAEAAKLAAEKKAADAETTQTDNTRLKETQAQSSASELRDGKGVFGSSDAAQELRIYRTLMTKIKTQDLPSVSANDTLRKAVSQLKKKVTRGLGQLTNTKNDVFRITEEISAVFQEARRLAEPAYMWILNHTAKAFIKQAETEVAVKADTAFPLAHVVVLLALASSCSEWSEVFVARLVKKCPYVLGVLPRRASTQSEVEWYKEIGWKTNSDGGRESKEVYAERMQGIFALFAACLQTIPDLSLLRQTGVDVDAQNIEKLICKELRPNRLWVWLSRMLNLTPTDMASVLITTFLEIAGNRFLQLYGRQATKILQTTRQQVMGQSTPAVEFPSGTVGGPALVRLTILLEDWEKSGRAQLNQTQGREFSV